MKTINDIKDESFGDEDPITCPYCGMLADDWGLRVTDDYPVYREQLYIICNKCKKTWVEEETEQ